MFAHAYKINAVYTKPLLGVTTSFDNKSASYIGTWIHLNRDGWIVTANHCLSALYDYQRDQRLVKVLNQEIDVVKNDVTLSADKKEEKIKQIKTRFKPDWISSYLLWFGDTSVAVSNLIVLEEADIAIAQIKNFQSNSISNYPLLKGNGPLDKGTSLCKMGYAFQEITMDRATDNSLNVRFPNGNPEALPVEGILMRELNHGKSADNKYDIRSIETSSTSIKGQSGGPIFDRNGTLWSVNLNVVNLSLGFAPEITMQDGSVHTENQFFNAGRGIHPDLLKQFLRDNHVQFQMA
ncbi:MAG: trypsin-like peptidase domain-containing protein [Cyclobacteriaceae bacterium]